VVDDRSGPGEAEDAILARVPSAVTPILVRNKIDLSGAAPGRRGWRQGLEVRLSARDGDGIEGLESALKECVGYELGDEGTFMARRRHLDALARTRASVDAAREALHAHAAGELAAEELRQAQQALGAITGEVRADDLLGEIFARFCIGK